MRTDDDVWAQVVAIAREHLRTGDPIHSPNRHVPNWITAVTETKVHRRSAEPRSKTGREAPATRGQVIRMWHRLVALGRAKGLRFAMALLLQIEGIGLDGGSLVITDQESAMKPFHARHSS